MTLTADNLHPRFAEATPSNSSGIACSKMAKSHLIRRILVALDFSSNSISALRHAVVIAELTDATLYLCHVVESNFLFGEHVALNEGRSDVERLLKSKDQLIALGEREVPPLIPTYPYVRFGKPARELVSLASELECDLVVIGTRGQRIWKRAILGSTAQQVTSHGPCAVLVVQDTQAESSFTE